MGCCSRVIPNPLLPLSGHADFHAPSHPLPYDSKAILKCIISRKQKMCSCAPTTTGTAHAASGVWRA